MQPETASSLKGVSTWKERQQSRLLPSIRQERLPLADPRSRMWFLSEIMIEIRFSDWLLLLNPVPNIPWVRPSCERPVKRKYCLILQGDLRHWLALEQKEM